MGCFLLEGAAVTVAYAMGTAADISSAGHGCSATTAMHAMHQSEHRLARFSIQSTCGVGFYGKQVYFASKWCNLLHIQAVASMPVRSL